MHRGVQPFFDLAPAGYGRADDLPVTVLPGRLAEASVTMLENATLRVSKMGITFNSDLQNKDRIVSVNGQAVTTEADFEAAIADCEVGDELTIEYVRYSGSASQTDTTTITIREYVPDSVTFS